jgi:hypothetical protein
MHNQCEPSQYLSASTYIPSAPHNPQLAVAMLNQGLNGAAYEHTGQATAVSPSEEQRSSCELSVQDPGKYKYHRQLLVLSKQESAPALLKVYIPTPSTTNSQSTVSIIYMDANMNCDQNCKDFFVQTCRIMGIEQVGAKLGRKSKGDGAKHNSWN